MCEQYYRKVEDMLKICSRYDQDISNKGTRYVEDMPKIPTIDVSKIFTVLLGYGGLWDNFL